MKISWIRELLKWVRVN